MKIIMFSFLNVESAKLKRIICSSCFA